MKLTHLTAAALASAMLIAAPAFAQTDADKQKAQSLSHGDVTKQSAQSLSHGDPNAGVTKQQ